MSGEPEHWRWAVRDGLLVGWGRYFPAPASYGEYRFDLGLTAATVRLAEDPAVGPTFGEEVPIRLIEAPVPARDGGGLRFALTFEVGAGHGGGDVVLSALPYAAMGSAMSARLAQTEGGWRARVTEPKAPATRPESANRFRGWTIGLCPNARRAQEQLLRCEAVQTLGRLTRSRTLMVGRKGYRNQVGREDVEECLSLLHSVVLLQALAGRGLRKTESKRWPGRPVAELVRYVYDDHVNLVVRSRRVREGHIADGVDPDTGQMRRDD